MTLENKTVVIAGATGGLGSVVSKFMADQGARLALFNTNPERLQPLVTRLDLPVERMLAETLNLAEPAAARAAAQAVMEKYGQVDIVLNLVGGWVGGKSVVEAGESEVADMLTQHLWTTFHMAQAFVPHLVRNRWGRLIVISSPSAVQPPAKGAPYAIGKAAQQALMSTLAQELKGSGVTVNSIVVNTIDAQHERSGQPSARTASWTTPEEIAALIGYLCSDEAQMINGARIPMHGSS
jgi:NAD(P)-dependent dehydrogenase (short-subunit alcohol dehydrogenase family)